jgi:hypothetical protein
MTVMVSVYRPNVRVDVLEVVPVCEVVRVIWLELEDPAVRVALPGFEPVTAISSPQCRCRRREWVESTNSAKNTTLPALCNPATAQV